LLPINHTKNRQVPPVHLRNISSQQKIDLSKNLEDIEADPLYKNII